MSIYPDKKAGVLTGRFRVELQKGAMRYRKRWDTLKQAQKDEAAVKATWAAGNTVEALAAPSRPPQGHTIQSAKRDAAGDLWYGTATEDTCWAHLRECTAILGEDTPLDAIDTGSIRKVVKALRARGKAEGTINRYLSNLRTFLVWCNADCRYRTLPMTAEYIRFEWLAETKGRIRWVTFEEERELEKHLPRNVWLVVKVAIETGCRRDELLTAKLDQINGTRLHLWKTKTNEARTVPMTAETAAMLTELITTKTMPTARNLRSWWGRAKTAMGLHHDHEFVFHITRHTRATRLVDAGVDILVIKEFLGHKRIETTQRYAHVKPQNLEDALLKAGEYERGLVASDCITSTLTPPTTGQQERGTA